MSDTKPAGFAELDERNRKTLEGGLGPGRQQHAAGS
jgi:hypothetical protein